MLTDISVSVRQTASIICRLFFPEVKANLGILEDMLALRTLIKDKIETNIRYICSESVF